MMNINFIPTYASVLPDSNRSQNKTSYSAVVCNVGLFTFIHVLFLFVTSHSLVVSSPLPSLPLLSVLFWYVFYILSIMLCLLCVMCSEGYTFLCVLLSQLFWLKSVSMLGSQCVIMQNKSSKSNQ